MAWLRELVVKNTGLKILSLFLALVLWIVVFQGDQIVDQTFEVPVRVAPGPGSFIMDQSVLTVKVAVTGTPILLRRFLPADVVARIPLSNEREGEQILQISKDHLGLPGELEVVRITPPIVSVKVERKERKRMPILTVLSGDPASGFRVTGVRKQPSTVMVEGARSEVAALEGVPTRPVDVSGRSESLQREVPLADTGKKTVMVAEDVTVKVSVTIEAVPAPADEGEKQDKDKTARRASR
ncbi:MAG: CdaR family protein [Deltaproteobacteria bacterium]|nr:CdaR family protein [Deltaproteobacteria bacterium]